MLLSSVILISHRTGTKCMRLLLRFQNLQHIVSEPSFSFHLDTWKLEWREKYTRREATAAKNSSRAACDTQRQQNRPRSLASGYSANDSETLTFPASLKEDICSACVFNDNEQEWEIRTKVARGIFIDLACGARYSNTTSVVHLECRGNLRSNPIRQMS